MPECDGYAFEWDLFDKPESISIHYSPTTFSVSGNKFSLMLEKKEEDSNYGCFLCTIDPSFIFPGSIRYKFVLCVDNQTLKSHTYEDQFYKSRYGLGPFNFIDLNSKSTLKIKIWIETSFSDFVEKPPDFRNIGSLLFDKVLSNMSFKVGEEVVYVIRGLLTTKSEYFRALLQDDQTPTTAASQIPLSGIDVGLFKMIVEWIYTMDIKDLNGMSPTILFDLERVYVAAKMYQVSDLCDSIIKYLKSLVNQQSFGDIYQLAKRINSDCLEKEVYREWISKSEDFNKNDFQIKSVIHDDRVDEGEATEEEEEDNGDDGCWILDDTVGVKIEVYKELVKRAAMYETCQKIVGVSDWDGDKESATGVIKCLTSLLIIEEKDE